MAKLSLIVISEDVHVELLELLELELISLAVPSSISSGFSLSCQLILTFSVNKLRMVKRLDKVPPAPTSLRS